MRAIVTRPAEQAGPLVDALERAGIEAVLCPLIEIEPIDDGPIDLTGYDWVIVTSANGAEQLAGRRVGEFPRVAAIGTATAAALRSHGIPVHFVPDVSTQEGLVAEFPRPVGRALFVGAEGARGLIVSELGASFRPVYRTRPIVPESLPNGDVVLLASASAAKAFAALDLRIPAVTIGPETSSVARSAGVEVAGEARTQDVTGLVDAVLELAQ